MERPGTRGLRLGLEDRYLRKESGEGDAAEGEREDRVLLRAQIAPLERLVLQVNMPWFAFRHHFDGQGVQDDSASGLGDVSVAARWELLRVGLEARHVLAVTGELKLPTGANDRHLPGAEPDEHLQLGSGSYDWLPGLSYAFGARPWTAYAVAFARVNGTNSRGFRYGHALFATLGARRAFGDAGRLLVSVEAQGRASGYDRLADGTVDPDSGGTILYATGSAAYALTNDWLVRLALQVPTVAQLNGVQSEHPVGYLTFSYDFTL